MESLSILLVEDNPGDARLVKEMLADAEGYEFRIETAGNLLTALDKLSEHQFDVALVDLSLPDCNGFETFRTIQLHAPGLPVVILTGVDDNSVALEAVRNGVQDYLVKGKLTAQALLRVLQYAVARRLNPRTASNAFEKARVVGFLSAKGGVGTTTVSLLFAQELQRQTEKPTLLMDLDVSSASAAFLLRVQAGFSIQDPATRLHRLDAQFWKNITCNIGPGLDLLQSPGAVRIGESLSGDRIRHVLRFARSQYQWIVTDMGRLDPVALSLLPEVQDFFVITTGELPALYEARRLLQKLLELGTPREQIRLVLNRAARALPAGTSDLESSLGYPVFGSVFEHSAELENAFVGGGIGNGAAKMRHDVAQIVSKAFGFQPPPQRRNGLLSRLARV